MKTIGILVLTLAGCASPPVAPPAHDGASAQVPVAAVSSAPSAPPAGPTTTAAPSAPGSMTLFVDAKRVDCEGEGPMKCLRIRESAAGEWTLLYQPIEGFKFEEGHSYELQVERTGVKNPPADGSSLRYRLVAIVRDTKTP